MSGSRLDLPELGTFVATLEIWAPQLEPSEIAEVRSAWAAAQAAAGYPEQRDAVVWLGHCLMQAQVTCLQRDRDRLLQQLEEARAALRAKETVAEVEESRISTPHLAPGA